MVYTPYDLRYPKEKRTLVELFNEYRIDSQQKDHQKYYVLSSYIRNNLDYIIWLNKTKKIDKLNKTNTNYTNPFMVLFDFYTLEKRLSEKKLNSNEKLNNELDENNKKLEEESQTELENKSENSNKDFSIENEFIKGLELIMKNTSSKKVAYILTGNAYVIPEINELLAYVIRDAYPMLNYNSLIARINSYSSSMNKDEYKKTLYGILAMFCGYIHTDEPMRYYTSLVNSIVINTLMRFKDPLKEDQTFKRNIPAIIGSFYSGLWKRISSDKKYYIPRALLQEKKSIYALLDLSEKKDKISSEDLVDVDNISAILIYFIKKGYTLQHSKSMIKNAQQIYHRKDDFKIPQSQFFTRDEINQTIEELNPILFLKNFRLEKEDTSKTTSQKQGQKIKLTIK